MADTLELPSRFLAYLGDMFVKSQQVVNFDSKKDNRVFTLNCCVSEGKVSDLSVALLAETSISRHFCINAFARLLQQSVIRS